MESTGDVNNNITYAGYQWDEETGLYYLNARMYDPKVARFLQEDTYRGNIRDPLSLNLYTYCNNEPIKFRDPTGHWKEGDSDRPVAVQLALMQVSDEWLAAETKSKKREQVEINPPEIEDVLGTSEEKRNMFNNRLDIELPEYTEVKNISIYKRYHTIRTFAEIVIPEQNYNDFISGLDVMEELSIEEKVEIWEVMTKKVKWVQLDINNITNIYITGKTIYTLIIFKPKDNYITIYFFE